MATHFAEIGAPRERSIVPGVVVMAVALLVAVFFLISSLGADAGIPYPYLIPWVFGLAATMAVPMIILFYQGKFRFDNPLVFATCAYFYPAFVVGGLAAATGLSQPYFLNFVQDPRVNFPLAIWVIMIGHAGLSVGYLLPIGRKVGEYLSRILPVADYPADSYRIPGSILLVLGILNSVAALALGLFGFQKVAEIGAFDGIIFLTTLFWLEASFLLWFVIFRSERIGSREFAIIALLVVTAAGKALFAGNRGSLLQVLFVVMLAYTLAGRRFRLKQTVWASVFLFLALVIGTIYGTTFRNIKGDEGTMGVGEYTDNIADTFDKIGSTDQSATLTSGFYTLSERLDSVSPLAVIVSSYEQLAPYEESYGLDNNIWKDTTTFFIPRVVWADKPLASEPRRFGDLYFNYGENSFIITPMGDLLRNYGMIGIPIGMMILGLMLRALYRSLVEDQPITVWRATVYFMIMSTVSYESFYGGILPYAVKVGSTAVVGAVIVTLLVRLFGGRSRGTSAVSR